MGTYCDLLEVIVTVRGGVAEIVPPIPPGVIVEIRDYDVDKTDRGLSTDFEGEKYLYHREGRDL
jgi:hypothetical protein